MQNTTRFTREEGETFRFKDSALSKPDNYMDCWILSFTQSLIKFIKQEMAGMMPIESYWTFISLLISLLLSFFDECENFLWFS